MPSPAFASLPALPTAPAPMALRLTSRQRTRTTTAESGKVLSRAYGGQSYEATLVYPPMKRDAAAPLLSFLQSRRGKDSIFKVELSGMREVSGLQIANFGNYNDDTKLHLITQTSPSLETYPAPRQTGASFFVDTVFMRASLARDVQQVTVSRDGLIRLEIDLIERL